VKARDHVGRIEHVMEWPVRAIVTHFENRLFELAMTVAMFGIAAWVVTWPGAIAAGSFKFLLQVFSPAAIIGGYAALAIARFAALIANGHWPLYGPLVRALGALFASFVWAQMAAALFLWSDMTGRPPGIGIPVYGTLALFELVSMYRAMARGAYDGTGRKSDP
jgi:hypothetical protein